MTRTVRDAALMLQAITGYDAEDPASRELPLGDYARATESGVKRLRVGVAREFFFDELESQVAACMDDALRVLATLSAEMRDVAVPVDTDRTVQSGEAHAFHARFVAECSQAYQPETLRRIRSGAEITTAAYIEKRRELEMRRRAASAIFTDVEVVVTPATPVVAPTLAELADEPDQLRRRELTMLRNTRPFNVLGLPAISVPCGLTSAGLPVGLQIAGPPGGEAVVLQVARAFELLLHNG
jgi:Asp-tRNA(Asn)/Glu-tRNA(Gln) amidotransferase A subunit family amidase